MCSIAPFKFNSSRRHVTHFIIMESELSIFLVVVTFCLAVCMMWTYRHILPPVSCISRDSWVFVFIATVLYMTCANNQLYHGLKVVFVVFHITLTCHHQYADMSEGIEYIKCVSDIFCSGVTKLSKFFNLSFMQFMGLRVFSLRSAFRMIVRIYVLYLIISMKREVWVIIHCLGLGHATIISTPCPAYVHVDVVWIGETVICTCKEY